MKRKEYNARRYSWRNEMRASDRLRPRRLAALLAVLSLLCGLCGCAAGPEDGPAPDPPQPSPPEPLTPEPDPVEEMVKGMTVEQKLAQMMIVAFRSDPNGSRAPTELTGPYEELLKEYCFGGVILFESNLTDIPQTVKFIRDCQAAAMASEAGIPLFVGVDQEGGQIARLPYGSSGPGNMALAAAGDPSLTREAGEVIGSELAALGFNMDFAPVCDVNSEPRNPIIGIRSFSDDPRTVSLHAAAFMAGLKEQGICTVIKHFPGHGNVAEDSHTGLPLSGRTLSELESCDLLPFAACAADADAVMTAHIQFPELERETYVSKKDGKEVLLPATLSRTILTGLLREKMGYEGLIVTDSLVMGAIASHFDETDAAALAINAGADLLLCPLDLYRDALTDTISRADGYVRALADRVRSGEIDEAELDDSVRRILKLKKEKGILDGALSLSAEERTALAEKTVGSPEHRAWEWEAAGRCLTLLKNEGPVLPLDGKDGPVAVLVPSRYRVPTAEYCSRRLLKEGILSEPFRIVNYDGMKADALLSRVNGVSAVLILSQSGKGDPELAKLIEKLEVPAVLISIALPYDAAHYPGADAVLCAYQPYGSEYDRNGDGPFGLNAAAALCAVFGGPAPGGRLPVNVPAPGAAGYLWTRGYGLADWGNS